MANAGTVTVTPTYSPRGELFSFEIAWACASDAATLELDSVPLWGQVVALYTIAGTTGPTDNSDLDIYKTGITNAAADILQSLGENAIDNSATVPVFVPIVFSGTEIHPPANGLYDLVITNNSVNGATGTIILYMRP